MSNVTDWRIDLKSGRTIVFPGGRPPGAENAHESDGILEWLRGNAEGRFQFAFDFDGNRYRAQHIVDETYGLRKIPLKAFRLEELNLHSAIRRELLNESFKDGGLVLVSGPTGSGKTTTAVATILGHLELFGGYCLAIEDPVEYRIAGCHGASGYCDQIEASDPDDYRKRTIQAMRCFPAKTRGILFLGEIRDEITAMEAAKIALSGFLVISTIHSFGIISAIQRMLVLMGGEDSPVARAMLADALQLVIYQKWEGNEDGRIVGKMLPQSDRVKGAVKNGKLDSLKDELYQIQIQMRKS